jgi:hypothetical protein
LTLNERRAVKKIPWVAHERPDQPFDRWTWIDDCDVCAQALEREAAVNPRRVACLKTSADRIYVTAELLHEVLARGDEFEALCYVADDYVREVFIVGDDALTPPARWWSLCRHEDQLVRPSGLLFRPDDKPMPP